MAKDDFLINIRNAYRELFGRTRAEHPLLNPAGTTRLLMQASQWLSPKAVEGFVVSDFVELSPEQRDQLSEAVVAFAALSRQASANGPITEEQFVIGRDRLQQISAILGQSERAAWLDTIERLLRDCEVWARRQDWETKRDSKQLSDSFLGRYEVPVLLIHSPQGRLLVDPIARYVVGGSGVVDLCVMPSFESARIVRDGEVWTIHTDFGDRTVRPFSEQTFVETAKALLQRV